MAKNKGQRPVHNIVQVAIQYNNNNNNKKVVLGGNQLPGNHGGKTRSLRRQKSGLRAKVHIFS